ncbi:MAG TPA: hypothetical protein VFN30_01900 [Chitinophagaceae bacterium]|nr:hypothetical protein [Chitinophagaceae bacterium]
MDKLKQYLREHRENLAVEEVPDELWPQINNLLQQKKSMVIPMAKWAIAASILVLVSVGIFYLPKDEKKNDVASVQSTINIDSNKTLPVETIKQNPVEIIKPNENPIPQIVKTETPKLTLPNKKKTITSKNTPPNEVDLLQQNFSIMIRHQEEKIRNTPIYAENAGYFHFFKKQLDEMGNDEKLLKEEVKKTGWTDFSIERLINIYQEKISLLKQLQLEINKMNNRAKQNNSTIQTQQPSFINI